MTCSQIRPSAWVQAFPIGGSINNISLSSTLRGTCLQRDCHIRCWKSAGCRRSEILAHAGHSHGLDDIPADQVAPVQAREEWDGRAMEADSLVSQVKWDKDGLLAAIAQQHDTGEILMMAYMNEESLRETVRQGRVIYYSRSRQQLWRKGDTSGQVQFLKDMILDCDGDALLLKVNQVGVACHTGRRSCFYTAFRPEENGKPKLISEVLMDPKKLYK